MKRIISILVMTCLLTFSAVAIASASIFDSVTPMDENYGGAYAKLRITSSEANWSYVKI